jgi:hypothetical protein
MAALEATKRSSQRQIRCGTISPRNAISRIATVANRQLANNTIIVFRPIDRQGRTVLLVLSGVAAAARSGQKKAAQPPLTLELSYILDAAHPDIFRIAKGQF